MRLTGTVTIASLLAASGLGLGVAPLAIATDGASAVNGTFSATSNGEWARQNDRYQDEATVRSTWTVSSTCNTPEDCHGTVTSSLGWTEETYRTNQFWYVKHEVPNFVPCPDGTFAPGLQVFKFYPANQDGIYVDKSNMLVGEDETTGVSGNCGRNASVVLELPFKLLKLD